MLQMTDDRRTNGRRHYSEREPEFTLAKYKMLALLFGKSVLDTKLASDRYAERCSDALEAQNNAERLGQTIHSEEITEYNRHQTREGSY